MKNYVLWILILCTSLCYPNNHNGADSLKVRIYNNGKYFIKELKIKIGGKEYKFDHIRKNKYSEFKTLPYIWNKRNSLETTVIIKKMFKFDEWWTAKEFPIDHIGETKIESGFYTLEIKTRKRKKDLKVERKLIAE